MTSARSNIQATELLARCGHAPARGGHFGGGFTLIEALVAVGAMALVTVGIAAIFSSVGKTVASGRRVSVLNSYAAMLEQQMRKDFAGMTRDGFLVIRNSYADPDASKTLTAADVIALTSQDPRPRARRIDEIMFFTNGDYTTVREPLHPAYVASSKNARIYFGHGERFPSTAPGSPSAYIQPDIDDPNTFGSALILGYPNSPNQFASSWTLLRHVTLLVKPEATTPKLPPDPVFNWKPSRPKDAYLLGDKDGQIALQPAATSAFRSMAFVLPDNGGVAKLGSYVRRAQDRGARPRFSSGLIDIATSDLTDIRSIVMGMPIPAATFNASSVTNPAQYPPANPAFDVPPNPGWTFVPGAPALINARSWMENAFPTSSDPTANQTFPPNSIAGTRIRYEPSPTAYVDVISDISKIPAEQAYRRDDQLALTAFNFVPGCTEFIVEWSFGDTDPLTGEIIWHGLERRADSDNNGIYDKTIARPYPMDAADAPPGGKASNYTLKYTDIAGAPKTYTVDQALIYGPTPGPGDLSETAYFGYIDPRFNDARPWAWPSMVRVTMSLTDPKNPGPEETFEFVFSTPGNPK